MTKAELENKISDATSKLIDMATDTCWNQISRNCEYIMSEIDDSIGRNFFERRKIRKKINDKKSSKSLSGIIDELTTLYDNLYDINLYIYKSLSNKTIIEIKYFLKTSHPKEFYLTIINNEPMLHCKVSKPRYITSLPNSTEREKKFDVNWELGGVRHEWNDLLFKIKHTVKKLKH